MFSVFIIAKRNKQMRELAAELIQSGFSCSIAFSPEEAVDQLAEQAPDLVIVDMNGSSSGSGMWDLPQKIKREMHLPVIALISKEALGTLESAANIDDFVVEPLDVTEVAARAKLLLWRTNNTDDKELIRCGDLVIDLGKCEVSICGKPVVLTFKEYELLKFLASNKGQVFTREALLNKIWGYDCYVGDRTVDVHIRRLRSKVEDSNHTFIETVRNIGYKFK